MSEALGGLAEASTNHAATEAVAANWPNRSGPHFIRAHLACKAAIEGRLELEAARQDFIEAAKEAHVYLN